MTRNNILARNVQIMEYLKTKLKTSPAVRAVHKSKSQDDTHYWRRSAIQSELTFDFSNQNYLVYPEDIKVLTYQRHALKRYVDPYKPTELPGQADSFSSLKLKDVKFMYDRIMGVKENYYKRTGDN